MLLARCTHSVVFPNMLATTIGLSLARSSAFGLYPLARAWARASTIPQIAPAAGAKIWREIRFRPATSTMLGNMTMSLAPTYWATLPLARVETMTLGKPIGTAAQRNHAINPLLLRQARQDTRRALGHGGDGLAAIAFGNQTLQIHACRGGDFGSSHIRL